MSYFFKKLTSQHIVYNALWEDPRIDRALLNIDKNANILTITSAGCNALNYLLDDPKHIDCIDLNPCQNMLFNLKKSSFEQLEFSDIKKLFFHGAHPEFEHILQELYATGKLPTQEYQFWLKHKKLLNGKGLRPSFYYYGTSGVAAFIIYLISKFIPGSRQALEAFFHAETL